MNKTRWARLSWVTLSLSFLAGCATDYNRNGDPLTGAPPAPPTPAAAALGKPAPPPAPPPVGSTAAGSTAALASGVRPGGVNSGLRIGEAPTPNSVPTRQPTATATLTGATLPVTGGRAVSYEQAQAQLTSRGVKWQWLEMKPDTQEWRFMCRLPSRANPNLNRTYEAKGPTHLAAVQAVLDQMDREGAGN